MATVLVTVNMVGTGIFLLPVTMASIGSISIWGWLISCLGATALGLVFALLGAVDPEPGGPYAYARQTFGQYLGFQTNYVYWTANLVGNIAVATTVTAYFTEFFPFLKNHWLSILFSIGIIWVATGINIIGPRYVGFISSWCTFIAMVPLVLIAFFGWFKFDPQIFIEGWKVQNISDWSAISKSATFALWAFMGVESASVSCGVIKNPKRNVPLATLLGLFIAAFLYVSTCTVLMGVIPAKELQNSAAPFSEFMKMVAGPWAAVFITVCAILKAGSSLIGWTLTISQSAQAASIDGMFPGIYKKTNQAGIPVWNFILSGILMSVIVVITASSTLQQQFSNIIDVAIILTLLPYLYSIVAFLRASSSLAFGFWKKTGVILVALLAGAYCFWALIGSEADLVQKAMLLLFLSIPLYVLVTRGQKNTTQTKESL